MVAVACNGGYFKGIFKAEWFILIVGLMADTKAAVFSFPHLDPLCEKMIMIPTAQNSGAAKYSCAQKYR